MEGESAFARTVTGKVLAAWPGVPLRSTLPAVLAHQLHGPRNVSASVL